MLQVIVLAAFGVFSRWYIGMLLEAGRLLLYDVKYMLTHDEMCIGDYAIFTLLTFIEWAAPLVLGLLVFVATFAVVRM